MKKKLLLFFIIISTLKGFSNNILGGEISYKNISGNTYKIQLALFVDCSSNGIITQNFINGTPKILIYDSTSFQNNIFLQLSTAPGIDPSQLCNDSLGNTMCSNPANTIRGINPFYYEGIVNLGRTSKNWRFIFQGDYLTGKAFRSSIINNIVNISCSNSNQSLLMLEATLNNSLFYNNSAKSHNEPSAFFTINKQQDYNSLLLDTIDFDDLEYQLINALDGNSTNTNLPCLLNYTNGVNYLQPIQTNSGFVTNSLTGQMRFTPNQLSNNLITQKVIERRNGQIVGSMMRENTFSIINSSGVAPFFSDSVNNYQVSSTGFFQNICTYSFNNQYMCYLFSEDTNLINSNTEVYINNLPPASIYNIHYNSSGTFISISLQLFKPSTSIFVTLVNNDCPYKLKRTIEIVINSKLAPIIMSDTVTNSICNPNCNGSITLNAISQIGGTLQYSYDNSPLTTSNYFTGLCVGNHSATVVDINGCSNVLAFSISNNNPVFPDYFIVNSSCVPGCDGMLVFKDFIPTGNYHY